MARREPLALPWAASGDGSGERAALSGARLLMFLRLRGALQANGLPPPPQGRNTAHTGAAEPLHFPKMRLSLGMSGSPTNQGNSKSLPPWVASPVQKREKAQRTGGIYNSWYLCIRSDTIVPLHQLQDICHDRLRPTVISAIDWLWDLSQGT